MREPVVSEELAFHKGRSVFSQTESAIQWTISPAKEETIASAIRSSGARIVVLGATRYRGPIYEALAANGGGKPTLMARFGVGYDGIDPGLCRRHGILVTNTPGTLDQSVSEHAMALLLSLARRVPSLDRDMRSGEFRPVTTFELHGKALGIAGFGNIGKRTALIASRGFGMRIHAFDKIPLEEQAAAESRSAQEFGSRYALEGHTTDFSVFAGSVGIVSIHLPVTDSTRGYFSRDRLERLRDGTLLVNTGRGALMDERALHDALRSGKLGGAALDVFAEEPYRPVGPEHDLRTLPNVVLTPHVASDTAEANANMANGVMANVRAFLSGSLGSLARVI